MAIYSDVKIEKVKKPFKIIEGVIYDDKGKYKDDYEDMSIPYDELRFPINEEEGERRRRRFFKEFGEKVFSVCGVQEKE